MFFSLPNIPNVALNLPEGARSNHLWELRKPWELDPSSTILKEDYTLPLQTRPGLQGP